jgi:DNA polymerase elongation subunit (family B)
MAAADRLIFACKEDTAVLTSLRAWLNEEREAIKERAIKEKNPDEILYLQGAAMILRKLADTIAQQVKTK